MTALIFLWHWAGTAVLLALLLNPKMVKALAGKLERFFNE